MCSGITKVSLVTNEIASRDGSSRERFPFQSFKFFSLSSLQNTIKLNIRKYQKVAFKLESFILTGISNLKTG